MVLLVCVSVIVTYCRSELRNENKAFEKNIELYNNLATNCYRVGNQGISIYHSDGQVSAKKNIFGEAIEDKIKNADVFVIEQGETLSFVKWEESYLASKDWKEGYILNSDLSGCERYTVNLEGIEK